MNRVTDLLDYLREETEEQEWATAGGKRDKTHNSKTLASDTIKNSLKPQALLDKYYTEGKISPGHLDDRCLSYMKNLQPDIQCQALSEYANRRSKDTLNNPPAYFMSLLQSLEMAAQKAHTLKKKGLREGILSILPLPTQNLFQELQDNGSIGEYELDSACLTWLAKLAAHQQTQVLEQYANVKHRDKLRCNAAFFMGLLRQVSEGKQAKTQNSVLIVPKPAAADLSTVSPEAKQKLAELYSQGTLDSAWVDHHCMGLLAALETSSQVNAVITIAADINAAENKRGYITQLLKNMWASAATNAAVAPKPASTQHVNSGTALASTKLLSNTGKVINPNEVSIRLNPSSVFYDANLTMCWRVLSRQQKAEWQVKVAQGKQPKLVSLSKPRQQLARQLHPGHAQYHAPTAAAWKNFDTAVKEELLHNANQDDGPIHVLPRQHILKPRQHTPKPDPEFQEVDFPPLGGLCGSPPETESIADLGATPEASIAEHRHPQIDNETSVSTLASQAEVMQDPGGDIAGGSKPHALPLYNMGMAFQQSLSLQDIAQADPSIARNKPLMNSLSQGFDCTSRTGARVSQAYLSPHGILPAKPKPPSRQAQQSLSTGLHTTMLGSLPQAAGPFPGGSKNTQTSAGSDQTACTVNQSFAMQDAEILAQHLSGGKHAEKVYPGNYVICKNQALVNSPEGSSSRTGLPHCSQQVSNKAVYSGQSVMSRCSPDENQFPGFASAIPRYVTPTPSPQATPTAPLLDSTVTTNAKTENAYVSFDEWQAQVRAKQGLAQSKADAFASCAYKKHYVVDNYPVSWSPNLVHNTAPKPAGSHHEGGAF